MVRGSAHQRFESRPFVGPQRALLLSPMVEERRFDVRAEEKHLTEKKKKKVKTWVCRSTTTCTTTCTTAVKHITVK